MKPVFNYEVSVSDRINQITNQPGHGVVKLMFPASFGDANARAALRDACFWGQATLDESVCVDNSGNDQDLYYEVKVDNHEDYADFIINLFGSLKDTAPIAIAYVPSKEEVGL